MKGGVNGNRWMGNFEKKRKLRLATAQAIPAAVALGEYPGSVGANHVTLPCTAGTGCAPQRKDPIVGNSQWSAMPGAGAPCSTGYNRKGVVCAR